MMGSVENVSYKLRYIGGFWLVEMAISTNQKPTIYRNLYENTGPQVRRCRFTCILRRASQMDRAGEEDLLIQKLSSERFTISRIWIPTGPHTTTHNEKCEHGGGGGDLDMHHSGSSTNARHWSIVWLMLGLPCRRWTKNDLTMLQRQMTVSAYLKSKLWTAEWVCCVFA